MAAETKTSLPVVAGSAGVRCAIYTRKSTDEGLDQQFNSLDAQRDAGESLIASQRSEGWILSPERYDDGGYTGANVDRPALQRLLADIEAGKVNCIVVYKVDRLTRSLLDFSKIVEVLEKNGATFVSVTEPLNTTSSIGRLTLNMLLSFAQFEREMISERTRDKMRAARRRGKWIGGNLVLGYDLSPNGGALVVNASEAINVRAIFELYLEMGSLVPVLEELDRRALRMKSWTTGAGVLRGGARFNKTTLHNLLTNITFTGRIAFEGTLYQGEHERIVEDDLFNRVQTQLSRNGPRKDRRTGNASGALLKGLVRCGSCGAGMTPTYVRKKQILYRYYVCIRAHQHGWNTCETKSVSAPLLENAVIDQLRRFARTPEMLSGVLRRLEEIRRQSDAPMVDPGKVRGALSSFDQLWAQLTIVEKERFIRTLVARVECDGPAGKVTVGFHSAEIKELCTG